MRLRSKAQGACCSSACYWLRNCASGNCFRSKGRALSSADRLGCGSQAPGVPQAVVFPQVPLHIGQCIRAAGDMKGLDHHIGRHSEGAGRVCAAGSRSRGRNRSAEVPSALSWHAAGHGAGVPELLTDQPRRWSLLAVRGQRSAPPSNHGPSNGSRLAALGWATATVVDTARA
jgi:hypothetical protein